MQRNRKIPTSPPSPQKSGHSAQNLQKSWKNGERARKDVKNAQNKTFDHKTAIFEGKNERKSVYSQKNVKNQRNERNAGNLNFMPVGSYGSGKRQWFGTEGKTGVREFMEMKMMRWNKGEKMEKNR